jgi:ribose transport system ATP-binding protein
MAAAPKLEVQNISKVFAGTVALSHVSLSIDAGEIHAILGENGAGKSTLIKILAGVYAPDAGEVIVDGTPLPPGHRPEHARAAGLAFIHQDFGLVGGMSVAENIALVDGFPRRAGLIDWRATREATRRILEPLEVVLSPDQMVDELPVGYRAIVAIARAVAAHAKVLVLDEPTASLAAAEVSALFQVMRSLRDSGVACVFVSHRMDEVSGLCDRATVLRNGRNIGTVTLSEVSRREVVQMIVGHDVTSGARRASSTTSEVRLAAEGLRAGVLRDLSFSVRAGEIVGLTGLAGSGASDLGGAVIGRVPVDRGRLVIEGKEFIPKNAAASYEAGVAFVPADRASEGLFMSMTLRENLDPNPTPDSLGGQAESRSLRVLPSLRVMRTHQEAEAASVLLERYDVRPREPEREASTLSGGNAQKLMLGRWLSLKPRIMILNEPTTGIDIGARHQIYELLYAAAADGTACVVISSDFHEIAEVCDRSLVLYRGRVAADLRGDDLNTRAVTAAALGESEAA